MTPCFHIKIKKKPIYFVDWYGEGFREIKSATLDLYTHGLSHTESEQIEAQYSVGKLEEYLDNLTTHKFLGVLVDKQSEKVVVINDKFSSNAIFYGTKAGDISISSNIQNIMRDLYITPTISYTSAYELLTFFSISPPRTIYNEIQALELGSALTVQSGACTSVRYWNIESRLTKKASNYDEYVTSLRDLFAQSVEQEMKEGCGISLSGGVDSGGILAMMTKYNTGTEKIPSVTIGGHGRETPDLESSRKTAEYFNSLNIEIYPSLGDLRLLPRFYKELQQPVAADTLFSNTLILSAAKNINVSKLFYGFGAEMLLGNLKICKVAYRIGLFERVVPKWLRVSMYYVLSKILNLSKNQKEFLSSDSWAKRFMHARAPLYTREKHLFKALPTDFEETMSMHLESIVSSNKLHSLNDRLVLMYVLGWVNYAQLRDFGTLGKIFGITPFSPFDTPSVAEKLFQAPNAFRKKNNWNKQVIRDMFRPYIPPQLYMGKVRSLIVPYDKLLGANFKSFTSYLRSNTLLSSMIDFDTYEKEYYTLPEPGLSLFRMLGLAVWYDTHHDPEHLSEFTSALQQSIKNNGARVQSDAASATQSG